MTDRVARTLRIVNEKGLHARASAKFAECCEGFDARAEVRRDGHSASGDSIMGLLMLGASRGTSIDVTTSGGANSHTAVVARELGIPALLGVSDALDRIPDGGRVTLDPVSATVTVVP